jgi:copper chaperone CopZ
VRDGSGVTVAGKLVTFSLNGATIASISPATALTNASGIAEVDIAPASANAVGAASISASADVGGSNVSGQADFAVSPANLSLLALTAGQTNLASGGQTSVSTTALINGVSAGSVPINVAFTASCGRINGADATLAGGVGIITNGSGIASALYQAVGPTGNLCRGAVSLVASSPGATAQSLALNVAAPTGTGAPVVAVTIVNAAGTTVSAIALGGGFKARASVQDASGLAVPGKLVTFNVVGATIASISPATALTNASGVAEVDIAPASVTAVGAGSISASADVGGVNTSGRLDFAVSPTNVSLLALSAGQTNLASGGQTQVSTTALIAGVPAAGIPINVIFSASCGRINGADATAGGVSIITNGGGVANAVYQAISPTGTLCSGVVTVSATSPGAVVQTLGLNVAAPTGTGTPTVVVTIVNAGGNSVNSIVTGGGFKARATVRDGANAFVTGKLVTFNLNGASIASLAPATALTNASGVAEVDIAPTSISAVVRRVFQPARMWE